VKVVLAVSGLVNPLPFKLLPVGGFKLDQGPPAVQLVALVEELQVRVAWSPELTDVGETESVAVGAEAEHVTDKYDGLDGDQLHTLGTEHECTQNWYVFPGDVAREPELV